VGLVQARSGVKIVAKSSSGETFVDLPVRHGLRYHKATPVFHQWRDNKRRELLAGFFLFVDCSLLVLHFFDQLRF